MAGNVALNEKHILLGIKTASHIKCKSLVCSAAKIRRILTNCYSVLVNNAIVATVFLGIFGKILDSTEIVADSKLTRGLCA